MPGPKSALRSPALLVLVAANLVPLIGALAFGWEARDILVAYWLENVAVGIVNLLKLLTNRHRDTRLPAALYLSGFFAVHYGIFTISHGTFVFSSLFGPGPHPSPLTGMTSAFTTDPWIFLTFFASHLFSYIQNYHLKGEAKTLPLSRVMFLPYPRIFVLHLTIIFGGMAVAALGNQVILVALLVILKTAGDILLHLREHRKSQAPQSS
ncbi:MAG: DUF6498-containing protein [Verrucomicrobiaceae bacterium]